MTITQVEVLPDITDLSDPENVVYQSSPAVTYISDRGYSAGTIAEVSLVLSAAFLFYRALFANYLKLTPSDLNATNVRAASIVAYRKLTPVWLQLTIPAIQRAYILGASELSNQEAYLLAHDYAESLGQYINQTSADSLVEGYQSLVNRKWSPDLAYIRAREAYGLDSQQMKSYVSSLEAAKNTVLLTNKEQLGGDASRALTDRFLAARAQVIGENETWTISQLAKQVVWLTQQMTGVISENALKRWITAADERVCPICRPLDGMEIKISDKFHIEGQGGLWAPAAHVNCRCIIELVTEPVSKADEFDPNEHPRGGDPHNRGRFSNAPQRQRAKKATSPRLRPVMERERSAEQEMVDEAVRQAEQVVSPVEPPLIASPLASPLFANPLVPSPLIESPLANLVKSPLKEASPLARSPLEQEIQSPLEQIISLLSKLQNPIRIIPGEVVSEEPVGPNEDIFMFYPNDTDHMRKGMKIDVGKIKPGFNFTSNQPRTEQDVMELQRARWINLFNEVRRARWSQWVNDYFMDAFDLVANEESDVDELIDLADRADVSLGSNHKSVIADTIAEYYINGDEITVQAVDEWLKNKNPDGWGNMQREFAETEMENTSPDALNLGSIPSQFFSEGTSILLPHFVPAVLVIENAQGATYIGHDADEYDTFKASGKYQIDDINDVPIDDPFSPVIRFIFLKKSDDEDDTPPFPPKDAVMGDTYEDLRYGKHPKPDIGKRFVGRLVTYRRTYHAGR